jgi:hypothetical protein
VTKTDLQRIYERKAKGFNDKARRLGLRGRVTAEDLARKPLVCHYCHVTLTQRDSEFDHVISFDAGGPNDPANIVRCCGDCNNRKFTKSVDEFIRYRDTTYTCVVCGNEFRPRYADERRGYGTTCSLACAARKRWL